MVKIVYRLSANGRKASLLAGGDGKQVQTLSVAHGDPLYPQAVALSKVEVDGMAVVNLNTSMTLPPDGVWGFPEYDTPQTVDSLIRDEQARQSWLEDRKAKDEVEKVAERKSRVAELLAAGVDSLLYWTGMRWQTTREADDLQKHLGDLYQQAVVTAKAKTEAADADKEAKAAAEKQAKAERIAREKAEIAAWAEQHGSDRLKKCVANNIECGAIYRDERLALEYPGWEVDGNDLPTWDEPRNPPAEALELLDKARASLPADWTDEEREYAELRYWSKKVEDGYGEVETQSGYAVTVDPGDWTSDTLVYGYDGPRDE